MINRAFGKKLKRIKDIFLKLGRMGIDICHVCIRFNTARRVAGASVLSSGSKKQALGDVCRICQGGAVRPFISLPLGWPMLQHEHLLYFDYQNPMFREIEGHKNLLFRTGGFFLSTRWNFCERCKNASLATPFTARHLNDYYSRYYMRLGVSDERRKKTKEMHARYIDSFLGRKSAVLEVGAAEGFAARYLAGCGHSVWVQEPAGFRKDLGSKKGVRLISDFSVVTQGSLDCIYMHHVLEHIPAPIEYLSALCRLLKRNGFLFIQSPDLSLQARLYPQSLRWCHYSLSNRPTYDAALIDSISAPASDSLYWLDALANNHIWAFTPDGLRYLLSRVSLEIQLIQQTVRNRIVPPETTFSWPIDKENGQTPNGITAIAFKN